MILFVTLRKWVPDLPDYDKMKFQLLLLFFYCRTFAPTPKMVPSCSNEIKRCSLFLRVVLPLCTHKSCCFAFFDGRNISEWNWMHASYIQCSVVSHVVRCVVVHDLIDVSMMFVMILPNGVRAFASDGCNAIYRHAHAVILSLSFSLIHKLNSKYTAMMAAMQYIRRRRWNEIFIEIQYCSCYSLTFAEMDHIFPGFHLVIGAHWVHAMAMARACVCVGLPHLTYEIWHIWNDIYEYHCDKGINRNVCQTLQEEFLIFEYWNQRRRCRASVFSSIEEC